MNNNARCGKVDCLIKETERFPKNSVYCGYKNNCNTFLQRISNKCGVYYDLPFGTASGVGNGRPPNRLQ
jgi:hypothetical protein